MSLDLTTPKFSIANARELVLFARMAYDEPPTVEDKPTDTQVLIRDLGDCIVVAPRGTSDIRDFVTDAECWRVPTALGGIHHGFNGASVGIHTKLTTTLSLMDPARHKPILFGAHSLGGAIAMLEAKKLRDDFFPVHSVYTFGAPRVGDSKFQSVYNATPVPGSPFDTLGAATFTVINDCDIVPRMPCYLAGNRCPGHVEFIPDLGFSILEDPSVFVRLGSDVISLVQGWWAKRSPDFLCELLLDHHVDNYIAALRDVEPKAEAA